jgi:hypothetical protein
MENYTELRAGLNSPPALQDFHGYSIMNHASKPLLFMNHHFQCWRGKCGCVAIVEKMAGCFTGALMRERTLFDMYTLSV